MPAARLYTGSAYPATASILTLFSTIVNYSTDPYLSPPLSSCPLMPHPSINPPVSPSTVNLFLNNHKTPVASDLRTDPVNDTSLPQGIQHSSVGEYPDQSVFDSDVVQEGLLGIHNERIRDPKEFYQSPIQTQALIAIKTQAFICPALTKKDGGGVILERMNRDS